MPHPSPQTTPYPRTRADLFFAPRRDATAELIVYDAAGHRAYLLNAAATIILMQSSGHEPIEIATRLARYFRRPVDPGVIPAAWGTFARLGLLAPEPRAAEHPLLRSLPVRVAPVIEPSLLTTLRDHYYEWSVEAFLTAQTSPTPAPLVTGSG